MVKAVLVMDDMPECCADCTCSYFERGGKELNLICGATGEDANNVGKPDWCPLRELPERKETHTVLELHSNGQWTEGMKAGFNACMDEILGKGQGD